jgi:predicted nucleotidyltransferase
MRIDDLQFDADDLAELCVKHHVVRLELIGSCAGGDATADSDVDVLVTFEPGAQIGLGIVALQQELATLFGRSVDLLTRESVEQSANKYFRHFALRKAEPLYERL